MTHSQGSHRGLPHYSKCFGQQIIQAGAVFKALAEMGCLASQFLVGESLDLGLQGIGVVNQSRKLFQQALIAASEDTGENFSHEFFSFSPRPN